MQLQIVNTWEIRSQLLDDREELFYYKTPNHLKPGNLIMLVDQSIGLVCSTCLTRTFDNTTTCYWIIAYD